MSKKAIILSGVAAIAIGVTYYALTVNSATKSSGQAVELIQENKNTETVQDQKTGTASTAQKSRYKASDVKVEIIEDNSPSKHEYKTAESLQADLRPLSKQLIDKLEPHNYELVTNLFNQERKLSGSFGEDGEISFETTSTTLENVDAIYKQLDMRISDGTSGIKRILVNSELSGLSSFNLTPRMNEVIIEHGHRYILLKYDPDSRVYSGTVYSNKNNNFEKRGSFTLSESY